MWRLRRVIAIPLGAAVLVQVLALPFDFANPAPDGSFGAPLAYVSPGCRYCAITAERLNVPALLFSLVLTAAVFGLLSAIARASWLPLISGIGAGYLALVARDLVLPEAVLREGISLRLWVIVLIGYAVGCAASAARRFARRATT